MTSRPIEATTEEQALDLADMLEDLLGPSLVLLTARSCSTACAPVGRRPSSIRDRGFGPIE
jgi:hypothetical protein